MNSIKTEDYQSIVFFTGAGMSAECGVPTYRGKGGIWGEYNWEDYACEAAFIRDPEKVLDFHEVRRGKVLACEPHAGHQIIANLQKKIPNISIVTQNIDGMHQRAGSQGIIELHGSMWRVRCSEHGIHEDLSENFTSRKCQECGEWLRPDITWFSDRLNEKVMNDAFTVISQCKLFISIGTSGVVWPAAGFPEVAKRNGAHCIEINPEESNMSGLYAEAIRKTASEALTGLFPSFV